MKLKRFNEQFDFDDEDFDMEEYNIDVDNTITHTNFADDWEGIYVDDKLVAEDHRIQLEYVLEYLIKNNIQMGDYKYKYLEYRKNGQYVDWVEEDEFDNLMKNRGSLTEFIQGCKELGYEIKLK